MTELHCLITVSILAGAYFRLSSPLSKNGFFGEEKCFFGTRRRNQFTRP
jgi:hypothetical protein